MPAERILACAPDGPLGTNGPTMLLCFWGGRPLGKGLAGVLRPRAGKLTELATPRFTQVR